MTVLAFRLEIDIPEGFSNKYCPYCEKCEFTEFCFTVEAMKSFIETLDIWRLI